MAWEVRFFADRRAPCEAPRDGSCPFHGEPDALTHARFLLHAAPDGRVEVSHHGSRRRAVYRLRGDRMVASADPP